MLRRSNDALPSFFVRGRSEEITLSRVSKKIWEAAEEENGYRAAKYDEFLAAELDEKCAENLWLTPARSVTGATMILHAILAIGEPSSESGEFPWPQVRTVLGDLIKIVDGGGFSHPTDGV